MRRATLLAAALVASAVLAGAAAAQDDGGSSPAIGDPDDRIEPVMDTVEQSRQTAETVGAGAVVGLGLGLIAGSASMFAYWSRKLS